MANRIALIAFATLLSSVTFATAQTPAAPSAAPEATAPAAQPPAAAAPATTGAVAPTRIPRAAPSPAVTQLPMTPEQQAKVKALAGGGTSSPGTVAADATLPANVPLRDLPAEIGLSPYGYAVVGNQVAVVDPDTRRVIYVIQ
jgi:hypothetical protein